MSTIRTPISSAGLALNTIAALPRSGGGCALQLMAERWRVPSMAPSRSTVVGEERARAAADAAYAARRQAHINRTLDVMETALYARAHAPAGTVQRGTPWPTR